MNGSSCQDSLLDVRPLVPEADRSVEQHRLSRVVGEVPQSLELDDLAWRRVRQRRLDDRVRDQLARLAVEIVERIVGRRRPEPRR